MGIDLFLWGSKNMHILVSALHFIQKSSFSYVFANIRRVPKWVQFARCNLDLAM